MKPVVRDPIAEDLERSLVDPNLASMGKDYGELLLDTVMDDPSLKAIPVFGTLIGLYKASKTISDRILMKKLVSFLRELRDIPAETRREQIRKLSDDPKYSGTVGETLFLLLDKQNNIDKPALLARGFRAYLLGVIPYEVFLRLAHALDRLDVTYLDSIKATYGPPKCAAKETELEHLFSCGLVKLDFEDVGKWGGGRPEYGKNELGALFYAHLLNDAKNP